MLERASQNSFEIKSDVSDFQVRVATAEDVWKVLSQRSCVSLLKEVLSSDGKPLASLKSFCEALENNVLRALEQNFE